MGRDVVQLRPRQRGLSGKDRSAAPAGSRYTPIRDCGEGKLLSANPLIRFNFHPFSGAPDGSEQRKRTGTRPSPPRLQKAYIHPVEPSSPLATRHALKKEEQGVQACARWPVTVSRGAQRAPCSVVSDGRLALGQDLATSQQRGIGGSTLPHPAARRPFGAGSDPSRRTPVPALSVEVRGLTPCSVADALALGPYVKASCAGCRGK
jgi:hypothetical protein